jgi:hypothetical protein
MLARTRAREQDLGITGEADVERLIDEYRREIQRPGV